MLTLEGLVFATQLLTTRKESVENVDIQRANNFGEIQWPWMNLSNRLFTRSCPICLGSQAQVFSTAVFSKVTSAGHEYKLETFAQLGFVLPLVYMRAQSAGLSEIQYTSSAVCRTDTMRR